MGEIIRSRGLATAVGIADASGRVKPAYCASACVLVYAGGKTRYGVAGSVLGVHRFVTTGPVERSRRRHPADRGRVLGYMTKMGVSSSIVEAMSETRDMRWLAPKQALAMNLVTDPARRLEPIMPADALNSSQRRKCARRHAGKKLPCRAFLVPPAADFGYAKTRERPALASCLREPASTAGKCNRNHAVSGLRPLSRQTKKQTRVQLYLPIADIPVNVFLILAMGAAVGFVSGMFGIGGGFLMTPLLIFIGIAPAVAVASVASHIAASSFSGAISYWRRRAIDPALAAVLLSGGTIGTALGVWTFTLLRSLGQLDLMIALSYVILLTTVGGADVLGRLARAAAHPARRPATMRRPGSHGWIHGLPLKMRFKRSKIYLSVIPGRRDRPRSSASSARSWASAAASSWCR